MLLSIVAVLSFFFSFPFVSAFNYSFGTPSECDNISLTWTGESFRADLASHLSHKLSRRNTTISTIDNSRKPHATSVIPCIERTPRCLRHPGIYQSLLQRSIMEWDPLLTSFPWRKIHRWCCPCRMQRGSIQEDQPMY